MHTKAIPTLYRGRAYRSRLEARYAALFDALEWPHEYEPLDLTGRRRGYIPDFLVRMGTVDVLVEVKPYTLPFDADAFVACRRMEEVWNGHALLVGATHVVTEDEKTDPEIRLDNSGMFPIIERSQAAGLFTEGTIEIGRMRLEGARCWDPAYLATDGSHWYVSATPTGDTHLDGPHFAKAQWSWATAGNLTQWQPRGRITGR